MWIATSRGLFEFKDGKLSEIIGPPTDEKITTIHAMLEDRTGNIWVSIGNGKVLCRQTNSWVTFNESSGLPFAYISSLAEAEDGTIWAGSLDEGLYYLRDDRFWVVREKDGLAMSSRNRRLSASDRQAAPALFRSMNKIKDDLRPGNTAQLINTAEKSLEEAGFRVDYVSIADASTLEPVTEWNGQQPIIVLVAAFLGEVRLIDNLLLTR